MGSPFYMAPEQWSDEEPDARADIYSLGVILYQMLAGEVPFKGSSIPSIMKKHLTLPPPSFQSMGASVPPPIEAVVRHALEKEVEARIDSIPTFLRDLHAALNSSPVVVAALRETVAMDPNKTMASVIPQPPTQSPATPAPDMSATAAHPHVAQETNFGASFESMAGTVSGAQLDKRHEERERREKSNRKNLSAWRCRRKISKIGSNVCREVCRRRSIPRRRECREVLRVLSGLLRLELTRQCLHEDRWWSTSPRSVKDHRHCCSSVQA
jgi:serine/threonine protein kinase